jgi:nuclear pore complex protein Nup93
MLGRGEASPKRADRTPSAAAASAATARHHATPSTHTLLVSSTPPPPPQQQQQDYHGYPAVQRDLHGLLASAQAARARTSRVRSAAEGVAAARLLAGAGFDAARLDAEVASLELQPTLEDVFPGGTGWAGTGGVGSGIAAAAATAAAVAAGGGGGALGAYGVEAYLQQVQDMAVLAAIQEAQQDAISSFERHMDTALAKEWASDKGRLLTVGGGRMGGGGGGRGAAAGGGASMFGAGAFRGGAGSPTGRTGGAAAGAAAGAGAAAAGASFPGGAQLQPREQAYLTAMRKLNAAAAKGTAADAVAELGAAAAASAAAGGGAAAASEGGSAATSSSGIAATWSLLRDILSVAHGKGLKPGSCSPAAFAGALVSGARQHLQAGFAGHMRATVARHRAAAHRGGDPDRLREVQAYLALRLRDRGALDLQQVGGHDTSWAQVYHALRAGYDDVALRAAERATDPGASATGAAAALAAAAAVPGGGGSFGARGSGGGGNLRPLLAAWLEDRAAFRAAHGAAMLRECERATQARAAAQRGGGGGAGATAGPSSSVRLDFMVLVYALLAGDARAVDALSRESPHLFATIEDFMWLKLALVSTTGGGSAGGDGGGLLGNASPQQQQQQQQAALGAAPAYSLPDLQAEINRWPASYYSRNGKEPLLYATVLLLSLQFSRALRFLWRDESAGALRSDAVHLAAALWFAGVLGPGTGLPDAEGAGPGGGTPQQQQQQQQSAFDVADALAQYGRRFVPSDPDAALQYLMPAAEASGGGVSAKGRMLRELLARCGDPAAVLGRGGAAGAAGPLDAFVADADERRALLEAVAYECQLSHQPDEARALFMAAGRPRAALRLVCQRLSAALVGAGGGGAGGMGAGGSVGAAGLVGPATAEAADVPALVSQGDEAVAAMESAAGGGAPDDASRRDAASFAQLKAVRALLAASRRRAWAAALQEAARLSFVPEERARVEVCRREVRALDEAVRERLPDVLACLAEALLGARAEVAAGGGGAGPDSEVRLAPLRARAEALKAFVLADLDPSIPPQVYARVNDVVRELS